MKMNRSREGMLHVQERILGSSPLAWAWRIRSSSFFLHLVGFECAFCASWQVAAVGNEDFSWTTSKWGHHATLFKFTHQFRCLFLVDAKIVHQHGHSDGIASGNVFHGVVVEGGLFVVVDDVLFREWGRQFAVGLVHRFKRLFCCGHIQEIAIGLQHRLTFGADHRIAHRCEGLFLY